MTAKTTTPEAPQSFHLAEEARLAAECGRARAVAPLARKLRGIAACADVLAAESIDGLQLGATLRASLIDAIAELTECAALDAEGLSESILKSRLIQGR